MVGSVNSEAATPTSFDISNGQALNANGYTTGTNGHEQLNNNGYLTNGHANGNGHIKLNGYTSSNDPSVNRDSYGSESYSERNENIAAEPIAIIGMGSLRLIIHVCQLLNCIRLSFARWEFLQLQALGSAESRYLCSRTISSDQIQHRWVLSPKQ